MERDQLIERVEFLEAKVEQLTIEQASLISILSTILLTLTKDQQEKVLNIITVMHCPPNRTLAPCLHVDCLGCWQQYLNMLGFAEEKKVDGRTWDEVPKA